MRKTLTVFGLLIALTSVFFITRQSALANALQVTPSSLTANGDIGTLIFQGTSQVVNNAHYALINPNGVTDASATFTNDINNQFTGFSGTNMTTDTGGDTVNGIYTIWYFDGNSTDFTSCMATPSTCFANATQYALFTLTNGKWSTYISGNPFVSNGQGQIFVSSTTLDITGNFNAVGLATSTLESFCNKNMPFDNSSLIQATLTAIPHGLCRLVAYTVIPTGDSLNQFATLSSSTQQRFPFSYVASVITVWNSLTASSTLNSPTFQYKLHDLGIGSTTALGNILPNVTVFSSTTVQTYLPTGTFNLLKALAGIAIILTLIGDIFFSVKRMMK